VQDRQFSSEQKIACPVLLQQDMDVARACKAQGTPARYLIKAEGKIASQLTVGAEALLALSRESRSSRSDEAESSVSGAIEESKLDPPDRTL